MASKLFTFTLHNDHWIPVSTLLCPTLHPVAVSTIIAALRAVAPGSAYHTTVKGKACLAHQRTQQPMYLPRHSKTSEERLDFEEFSSHSGGMRNMYTLFRDSALLTGNRFSFAIVRRAGAC